MGRSDIYLKLEIIKKSISILILLLSMHFGVKAIAVSGLAYSLIATMFNAAPNRKLLGYSYFEQVKDIFPCFALALLMGAAVYPIALLPMPTILTLLAQVVVGAFIYVGLSAILKLEPFYYIFNTIRQFKRKG